MTAVALLLGLLIDHFVGEAKRWHPLVGFGDAASILEKAANPSSDNPWKITRPGLLGANGIDPGYGDELSCLAALGAGAVSG